MSAPDAGRITVDARAKVNLYLHVVGRRADGYHLLDTLMVFTELGDRVTVEPSETLTLDADGPFVDKLPADPEDNLIMRAAHALAEAADVPAKARIRLTKNLPVSAGLGSGSSDAAATLKALSRLWQIPDGRVDLPAIGLTLGADVPACIAAEPVFVGRHRRGADSGAAPASGRYPAGQSGRAARHPVRVRRPPRRVQPGRSLHGIAAGRAGAGRHAEGPRERPDRGGDAAVAGRARDDRRDRSPRPAAGWRGCRAAAPPVSACSTMRRPPSAPRSSSSATTGGAR